MTAGVVCGATVVEVATVVLAGGELVDRAVVLDVDTGFTTMIGVEIVLVVEEVLVLLLLELDDEQVLMVDVDTETDVAVIVAVTVAVLVIVAVIVEVEVDTDVVAQPDGQIRLVLFVVQSGLTL